jgi:hypothetical protein
MFTLTKKQPNLKKEFERRKSQTQKILELLRRYPNGQKTNVDLQLIAFNYTMRVSELRKEGHKIIAVYERPGVFRYFYKGFKG